MEIKARTGAVARARADADGALRAAAEALRREAVAVESRLSQRLEHTDATLDMETAALRGLTERQADCEARRRGPRTRRGGAAWGERG